MIRMFLVGLCLLVTWPAVSAAQQTYYIATSGSDTPSCGPAGQTPCRTFNYVRANRMSGGDTVYFRAGDYPEIRTLDAGSAIPSGANNSQRTLIAGYPGEFVTMNQIEIWWGSCNDHPGQSFYCGLTQYVTFQNFHVSHVQVTGCRPSTPGTTDYSCGAHFIRFQDLEITNGNAGGSCVGGSWDASDIEFLDTHIHHCGPIGSTLDHGVYSCWVNALFDRVEINNAAAYGLHLFETAATGMAQCSNNTIVRNSYFHHNGHGGVLQGLGHNQQFYNNVVSDNGGGYESTYSGNAASNDNLQVYNNTIVNNNGAGINLGDTFTGHNSTNPKVRNNILLGNNGPPLKETVPASGAFYSNNLCPNTSDLGCTHTGNAAFVGGGSDPYAIGAGSAARNVGVTLGTFTTDKRGLVRADQGSAWDIGAYEYQEGGGPSFDFSVAQPSPQTVQQGTSIQVPVVATLTAGTAAPVAFDVTTLPTGVSRSFTGSPCTPTPSCTATLTLTATGGAPVGTFNTPLLIGTSGSLSHQTNFTITVSAPTVSFDFSLGNPGPQTVARSAATNVPMSITLLSAPAGPVTLSVTAGLPSGVSASFSNNPCTPPCTSTLTLTAAANATVGTAPLTVHGVGGGNSHDRPFDLTVTNIVSSGNPIYVRKTVGSPANSCVAAEQTTSAKQSIVDACQCMTVPGKVMYIEGNGNVYSEMLDTGDSCPITGGNGPAYDTATRLEGYGTSLPVIQAPAGAAMALWLRGSGDKYTIFKKLTFDAANQAGNAIAVFNLAHHIRFEDVEAKNTGGNFEVFYLVGASNIELVDTFFHEAGTEAMTLDGAINNFLCQRCHLFNAAGTGLTVTSSGTKANLTFDALEIRNNGGTGLDLGTSTGTAIQNMINHSNGGRGVWIHTGASGTRAYNNTLYANTGVGLQCDTGASNTELRNNSVYGNTGGNIVNNCGATVAKNLCAVTSAACALGGDPLFVAPPGNLHVADGSPAIDAGDNIPSILTDYDGNPRQQGQQDIGAYERTQGSPSGQDVTVRQLDLKQAAWYF